MPEFKVATYMKTIYLEKKTITVEAKNELEAFDICSKITDEQLDNDTYWDDIEVLDTELPPENISPMWIENEGTVYPDEDPFDDEGLEY